MEHNFVRFLHSRFGAMSMMAIAIIAVVVSYCFGNIEDLPGDTGLWLPSANDWMTPGIASMFVNVLLNVLVAGMLVLLNKWFNVLRTMSDLGAGVFLIMQMSEPSLMGQFYGGTLMCFIVLFSTIVLYCTYNQPYPRQPIFLIFLLLTVGTMTQYAYIAYIPIFLLGCAQMRIFGWKTLMAAIIGVITPIWIMVGFGFVSFSSLEVPHYVNIFSALDSHDALHIISVAAITGVLAIVMSILNLLKVFNYNSKMRAYNGFLLVLSVVTTLMVVIDYTNLSIYIPLLNCCTAFQVGHFFALNRSKRSYIAILSVILIYVALYCWSLT